MAFWALGKVKNLSEKLNLKDYKDYGSKIIQNYMVNKQNEESQFFDFQQQKASTVKSSSNIIKNSGENVNKKLGIKLKQELSDQQWLQVQLSEYKKLSQMQTRLLAQHEVAQQKRLSQQYEELQKQLQELQKQESEQLESLQKQRLKVEIREGKKSIQSLIRQNVLLREQIQRKKV